MTNDIIIYALCGIMVVMAVVSPLVNIMFRRVRTRRGNNERRPSFSIIIPAHDNASELERHLPCFLSQEYDGDFEVIVVESKTGDRTEEVIKHFSSDKRLYSTFIPSTSKYMSRKKLAMTVGAKAAKNEWLIFVDAESYPVGNSWLNAIASELTEDKELALGYGNYCEEAKDFQRFVQFVNSMYALRKADKGTAYRAASDFAAVKRDIFMNGKGFDGNLMCVRGEYDFLINKFADSNNTAVITSPDGWIKTDAPTPKTWKNTNLFYMDTKNYLDRSLSYRTAFTFDYALMHIVYIILIVGIILGILLNNILLLAVSTLSFIICITSRILIAGRTMRMYDEQIPLWKIVPFEAALALHSLKYKIKYMLSNKNDFTSHKL